MNTATLHPETHLGKVITGIDWPMLKDQKMQIMFIQENHELFDSERAALEGVLNFLDAFSDALVEDSILTEQEVCGPVIPFEDDEVANHSS